MNPDNESDAVAMSDLYKRVHNQKVLFNAWRRVRANGKQSPSDDTKKQIAEFEEDALAELNRIQRQLRERRFHFGLQKGVAIRKEKGNSKRRPVVVAPIKNRIVQRSILDVLQAEVPAVRQVLDTPTSIGGIPGRGTHHAISLVMNAIQGDATWFASSDISGFFTKIPRDQIVQFLINHTSDPELGDLFRRGVETTLGNMKELGEHRELFPIGETGVAQGSPLSPLMGNILLRKFDEKLNARRIRCIRYIDDFIILGASRNAVSNALASAKSMLDEFGMTVYEPKVNPDKADFGPVTKGFDFLGCHINPGQVAPSRAARERLLLRVQNIIATGKKSVHVAASSDVPIDVLQAQAQVQTLAKIDATLKGWAHAFSFCNTPQISEAIDAKVDDALSDFMGLCHSLGETKSPKHRRRILGIHLLADTPQKHMVLVPHKF